MCSDHVLGMYGYLPHFFELDTCGRRLRVPCRCPLLTPLRGLDPFFAGGQFFLNGILPLNKQVYQLIFCCFPTERVAAVTNSNLFTSLGHHIGAFILRVFIGSEYVTFCWIFASALWRNIGSRESRKSHLDMFTRLFASLRFVSPKDVFKSFSFHQKHKVIST